MPDNIDGAGTGNPGFYKISLYGTVKSISKK